MTDNQPEIVASADLTPVSPKPINLSSPVALPSLQDQADSLDTMSQPPSSAEAAANGATLIQAANDEAVSQNPVDPAASLVPDELPQRDGTEGVQEGSNIVDQSLSAEGDEYAKNFDSPAGEADDEPNVSNTNAPTNNTAASLPLTNPSETSPSHAISLSTATKSAPEPTSPPIDPVIQLESSQQVYASKEAHSQAESTPQTSSAADLPQEEAPAEAATTDDTVDIQALVDKITAEAAANESSQPSSSTSGNAANTNLPVSAAPSSLPPRPPQAQQPTSAHLAYQDIHRVQPTAATNYANMPPPGIAYPYAAPGTMSQPPPPGGLPPIPSPTTNIVPNPSMPMPPYNAPPPSLPNGAQGFNTLQTYDAFLQEERKYVSEAKWDRFPEGSRLFIGNLSSERVSKREVFDIFTHYGRLAQISLKQAYGFVQYHTVAEGQAAMDHLQGIEIKGRKIHLEFSRAQKKDGDGDRRGNKGRNGTYNDRDRYDSRRRDDYRPRSPSPGRRSSYSRDRGAWEAGYDRPRGGRSRSPAPYNGGNYRRRSVSPYRRGPPMSEADLDIPRRYAGNVPDVQLLLLQEVNRDFVSWVQDAFVQRGLKVDVMFLNPRFPRELVIQRQVVEGVHAVSELDYQAQSTARIPIQVFDRSAGRNNTRFDQYRDLDPKIAAEVVVRAKSTAQFQPSPGYGAAQYPPAAYPPAAQPAAQPAPSYPTQPVPAQGLGALSNLDNATLQKVLAAIQTNPQGVAPGQPATPTAGVDVTGLLAALGNNSAAAPGMMPQQPAPGYPTPNSADAGQHVQDIMAQLARYRQ